jgi:hypothetical protein
MWGTSSPDDKLTGDLTNVIEAISIYDRGSDCLAAGKLAPGNLGLFQQHRSKPEWPLTALMSASTGCGQYGPPALPIVGARFNRRLRRGPFADGQEADNDADEHAEPLIAALAARG